MSTVTKNNLYLDRQRTGTPYDGAWRGEYNFTVNASGILVDSDKSTAIGIGDIVRIGILPGGLRLHDSLSIISDAFTAAATMSLGFQYVDGVDVTATPQDADYFGTGVALSSQDRLVASNDTVRPLTLPKDAYLILTTAGAALDAAGVLDVIILGVWEGQN